MALDGTHRPGKNGQSAQTLKNGRQHTKRAISLRFVRVAEIAGAERGWGGGRGHCAGLSEGMAWMRDVPRDGQS